MIDGRETVNCYFSTAPCFRGISMSKNLRDGGGIMFPEIPFANPLKDADRFVLARDFIDFLP